MSSLLLFGKKAAFLSLNIPDFLSLNINNAIDELLFH